jgi:hypothetical protein
MAFRIERSGVRDNKGSRRQGITFPKGETLEGGGGMILHVHDLRLLMAKLLGMAILAFLIHTAVTLTSDRHTRNRQQKLGAPEEEA